MLLKYFISFSKEQSNEMLTNKKISFHDVKIQIEQQCNAVQQNIFDDLNQLIQRRDEKHNRLLLGEISISNCQDDFIKQLLNIFTIPKEITFYKCIFSVDTFTQLVVKLMVRMFFNRF